MGLKVILDYSIICQCQHTPLISKRLNDLNQMAQCNN